MSRYKDRIAKGLCGKCGHARPPESKAFCDDCRTKERLRAQKRREQAEADGNCSSCGSRPRVEGKSKCSVCLAGGAASARRTARKRKATGFCQACGQHPPIPNKTICQGCSDRMSKDSSERYHQRRAEGKCNYCDRDPEPGSTMCAYHLEQTREGRERLKREVMEAYGGCKCSHCPETDLRFLEIDHIDGGGRKHLREEIGSGGHNFYQWLKRNNYPNGFRVLCRTCNNQAHVNRCRANDKRINEQH